MRQPSLVRTMSITVGTKGLPAGVDAGERAILALSSFTAASVDLERAVDALNSVDGPPTLLYPPP
jgi:hypothetical protein